MFSPRLAAFAILSALVGSPVVAFNITNPSSALWWVADSQNTLTWTCHDNPPASTNNQFVVLLNNTDPNIYSGPGAIMANINNADCSETVAATLVANLKVATGYTIMLADMADERKIYAVSEPFEIKAQGSAYPTTSVTPAGQTGAASGSATGSSSSSTSTSTSNDAPTTFGVSAAGVLAALGAAIGLL